MSSGYRLLILTFGLILAAHHLNAEAATQQPDAKEATAHNLNDIATTYNKQAKRSESPEQQADPCSPGQEKRYSDLCAQWKAAYAAADSARWAAVSTWVSGVSGLLVLVAIGLAYQANVIARQTAQKQLMAYIGVDSVGIHRITQLDADAPNWRVRIVIKNFGQTPATILDVSMAVTAIGDPERKPSGPLKSALKNFTVNPGHTATVATDICTSARHDDAIRLSIMSLVVRGQIEYSDIYGMRPSIPFSFITDGATYAEGNMREHRPKDQT